MQLLGRAIDTLSVRSPHNTNRQKEEKGKARSRPKEAICLGQ